MNRDELLRQIDEWHETDEHQKIIDAIEALPSEEWGYELTGMLARAYNNVSPAPCDWQLEKAVSLLESVKEEGKDDAVWHYRLGYALYYLDREEEALSYFRRASELDPDDEDALQFIEWCKEDLLSKAVMYTEEEIEAVEEHISKYFGEFEHVFHEIVSPDIHVDICLIPPTEERDYYTLVTMGMGAYQMNVPEELAEHKLERAELAIDLPPDWKLDEESLKDERWYWPIRLLKSTARLPIQRDVWLGWGHTVGIDEGETYAENTELCGCILIDPQTSDDNRTIGELPNGDTVNFYQLIPLYHDEIEYKIEHGAEALLDQLRSVVSFVVDPDRPSAFETEDFFMDEVTWHLEKIPAMHLPIDEINAYNHMAIYLRWCMEHDLMSEEFSERYGDTVKQVKTDPAGIDLREFLRDELDGKLLPQYFNDDGAAFAMYYYGEEDAPCFPADIDNYSLGYFGPERYHSDEFQDEAYLFVPFDEAYYQGMAKVIQHRWDAWQNIDDEAEYAAPSELAQAIASYLDCECEYFPPMSNNEPIMAAYSYACRLAPREGFVPMLITVDETLWECLILNSDPDNDGAEGYGFDPKAVADYRKQQLSQPVPDGKTVLSELIGDRKEEAEDDELDWNKEVLGDMDGGEANNSLTGFWDYSTKKTYPLILAKIPVKNPWEVFAYLPFGAWNECPDTPSLMAAAKHWYEKYGAVPAVMTHDELELVLPKPVSGEDAMEVALEQYGFCPDVTDWGREDATVGCLADTLRQSTVWYFWWD